MHLTGCEFSVIADVLPRCISRREQEARLRQMACFLDPARRLEAARGIVAAKIVAPGLYLDDRAEFEAELALAKTVHD